MPARRGGRDQAHVVAATTDGLIWALGQRAAVRDADVQRHRIRQPGDAGDHVPGLVPDVLAEADARALGLLSLGASTDVLASFGPLACPHRLFLAAVGNVVSFTRPEPLSRIASCRFETAPPAPKETGCRRLAADDIAGEPCDVRVVDHDAGSVAGLG